MPKKETRKRKQSQSDGHPTNVWDAIINFTNIAYDLLNSGNIFGLILLLVFGLVGLTIFKIPTEDVAPLIRLLIEPFFKVGISYYVLFFGLSFSLYGNIFQRLTYRKEIKRLTDLRKELVHGREIGELKDIEHHTSSKTNL